MAPVFGFCEGWDFRREPCGQESIISN